MTDKLRWGILSTGRIAGAFAKGVATSEYGQLQAVGSRSLESAQKFAAEHGIATAHGSYEALLADPNVDAVYIATPHPWHPEWTIKAAEAGKHILCEKPAALSYADAAAGIEAARRHGVFFMEAFMYRCHPQTAKLVELIKAKVVGDVRMIRASFAFNSGFNPEGRLFKNELGGGGILDVGCYPTSMAQLIAGAASGVDFLEPSEVVAAGELGPTGVDHWTAATLKFPGGIVAQVATGVQMALDNTVVVFGSAGRIEVPSPWFCSGREGGTSTITVHRGKESEVHTIETPRGLYSLEADTVARHIARGEAPSPAMTHEDTLANMRTLDRWRAAIGVVYEPEKPANRNTPVHGRPLRRPTTSKMKFGRVPGLDRDVARMIMGVDNQRDYRHATVMFDDYIELGGNCFDTARIYLGGKAEGNLGNWIHSRGIRNDIVLLTKGAHTPNCYPDKMNEQFAISLSELQTDYVDIYMLHRDNLEVPVGEFIDALNEHIDAGRMKVIGASNWTLERVQEANDYAAKHGRKGFTAVSNNFSLARMIDPVWAGCIAASEPAAREWFEKTQTALMPWSSQARGFFLESKATSPDDRRDPELVRCWYSPENFERKRRAVELARKKNVLPINIAAAYVLNQSFPTFALFGPRTLRETWTSLPALDITLTPEECAWLDLRA